MAITYNAGTNTITVTGYTEAVPCTCHDIKLADMAGAWGKVDESYGIRFVFRAKLTIGDGTTATWFADTSKQIHIPTGVITGASWGVWMNKKVNANIRFGECTNATKKIAKNGCVIHITRDAVGPVSILDGEDSSGNVELYGCTVSYNIPTMQCRFYRCQNGKFYSCLFNGRIQIALATGLDVYNATYLNTYSGLVSVTGVFDSIRVYKSTYITNLDQNTASDVTFSNIVLIESTYVARGYSSSRNLFLINCEVETWAFTYSSYSGKFYRQYTFDLKSIEEDSARTAIASATVKIWDLAGNLVVNTTTDANGDIAQQTLTFGYYYQGGGDTPVMQTPHKIELKKPGYETFVKYMYMDYQRKEVLMMRKARPLKLCDDRLVLQVCSESEKEDRFIYTELV